MVETFLEIPFHFTIEFFGFVVCAGAVFLVPARRNLIHDRTAAFAVALGSVALATAAVAHGAGFIEAEDDPALMALYGVGAVSIAAGVVGGGAPRDRIGRLCAAAILFGASVVLTWDPPARTPGVGAVPAELLMAHVLRAGAYLAFLWWLWAGMGSSVRSRFIAVYAGLLVVVVLALSVTLTGVISANVEREEIDRVRTQLRGAVASIRDRQTATTRFVRAIATSAAVRSATAERSDLSDLAESFATSDVFPLDAVVFTSPRGSLLGYAGSGPVVDPEEGATPLSRSDILSLLGSPVLRTSVMDNDRELAAGIDRLRVGSAAIVAAGEIRHPRLPGRRVGAMIAIVHLDHLVVDAISSDFRPAVATLMMDGRVVATALPAEPGELASSPDARPGPSPGGMDAFEHAIGEESFFTAVTRLEAAGGRPALALSTPAEVVASTRREVVRGLFLVTLGVGAVALLLAWLLGRRITRPIQELTQTAQAVKAGDLSARARVSGGDEVGQLGETFNRMTASLVETTRAERALRDRIEAIIQSMADGLVAVDADTKVLAFNLEAELLTSVDAGDAIGRPVGEVLDARDGNGNPVRLPIHDLAEGAVTDVYMARRKGAPVPVAVTCAVLRAGEEPAGGVAVIRDMTREREIEKIKGEFLSNISHELRTPLTPIKGYAELLSGQDVPPDRARSFARGIVDSTRRLERIVALLVDFSALEAGRLAPRAGAVDMAVLVRSLVDEWSSRSERHEVVADIEGSFAPVNGDERLLRRSLEEILDNAVKFSPRGGRITVSARSIEGNGASGGPAVQVTVADQGIGIPPEDLTAIFTDFHQVNASETRPYGGLGLGLAFVRRIVEAHRGDVAVESRPDDGTRFTITIPAAGSPPRAA